MLMCEPACLLLSNKTATSFWQERIHRLPWRPQRAGRLEPLWLVKTTVRLGHDFARGCNTPGSIILAGQENVSRSIYIIVYQYGITLEEGRGKSEVCFFVSPTEGTVFTSLWSFKLTERDFAGRALKGMWFL